MLDKSIIVLTISSWTYSAMLIFERRYFGNNELYEFICFSDTSDDDFVPFSKMMFLKLESSAPG